jgi:hypothetical protein
MKSLKILGVVLTIVGLAAVAYAASKTWKYKCHKCDLIQEYSSCQAGGVKCPKDNWQMTLIDHP